MNDSNTCRMSDDTPIPIMTEEDYLRAQGASFMKGAEPALHRTPGGLPQRHRYLARVQRAMTANNVTRETLRKEYQRLVAAGKIRPPSRVERLVRTARGNEDHEAVHAARRLLRKRGISWTETP